MSDYGLIVIGSGPAGVSAAAAYDEAGGPGPILLVSADAHAPYERPPLTKEVLAGAKAPEGQPITEASLPAHAELRLASSVTGVDPEARTVQVGGDSVGYDRLVIAAGSHPRPFADADGDAEVHLLRSLDDAQRLVRAAERSRSAVVIGSGFIGCEAAASLAVRGVATTLVTPEPAPQEKRLGPYAAAQIASWLTDLGVELRTGVEVTGVRAPHTVHLDDGTTLSPELILAATGIVPNGDLLEGTGIQLHRGRIVADEHLQAGPGIWVAGDIARGINSGAGRTLEVEHWGDALTMGEIAGANAAAGDDGEQRVWREVPGFWSTIGEHTLQYAAWGDGYSSEEVIERTGGFTIWYADDAGTLVGVLAYNADDEYQRGGRLIGAGASVQEALRGDDVAAPETHEEDTQE